MMLDEIFIDVLLISLTTSLLITAMVIVSPRLRKHYSAKWRYWLWLIIAIRLLLPYHISLDNAFVSIEITEHSALHTIFQEIASSTARSEMLVAPQPASQPELQPVTGPVHTDASTFKLPSLLQSLAWIWLLGGLVVLLYHISSYWFFRKQALRWSKPFIELEQEIDLANICNEIGIKRAYVTVLVSEKAPNPMLVGMFKPVLLLPHQYYDRNQLIFIVKHELIHYKRHDIFYKLMLMLVQAMHWFNPIVWFMAREASRELEIYCDETLVAAHDLAYRKQYCEAILDAMQGPKSRKLALSTNFAEGVQTMQQRFISILNVNKKRNGLSVFVPALLLIISVSVLASCTNIVKAGEEMKPGTIYSSPAYASIVTFDAGNSYSIDAEGNILISYRDGEVIAKSPVKVDPAKAAWENGISESGFFISEDKTAIVYNSSENEPLQIHVAISDDMGKTWSDSIIEGASGSELFIGFTNKTDGWMSVGNSAGVARALNFVYQTSDGGKTWQEIGNPNEVYAEHLTGVGFSTKEIGFFGYRYFADDGPVIYWTQDQGKSWERLLVSLPEKFDQYKKNPLSPTFNGKEGYFPVELIDQEVGFAGIIYLVSDDNGLNWEYDAAYDQL